MSCDRLTFAGRVQGPKDASIVGAQVVLTDDSRKQVLASTLTGSDGDFRIELIQAVNPALFARVAKDKVALQVFSASGDALAAKGGLTCCAGEACMVDFRLTAAAFKRFQPLFPMAQRLSGPMLEPNTLALIDSAISAMVPPGTPGHNYYLKAARCPLPDIQGFDSLLNEAWSVLDGAPDAERRFRAILNLVPERRPEGRRPELIKRGAALVKSAALQSGRGDRASVKDGGAVGTGAHPRSIASAMLRPIPNGPLANPFPCALPFERMAPPYLAALRIARDFDDAAALVGALELSLCGLDRVHRLLDGALRGLAGNDFRDLRGMLDHFGALCGPDDGPLPPFPPGPPGPKPECPPLPPFPDIDPCDLERRACLRELISAFQNMRNPPQTYTIASITPIDACHGDQVVIIGSNFGSAPGLVCFPFGSSTPTGTCVPATSWSDTEVRAIVPAGSGSGELQLRIVDNHVVACGKIFLITRKGEGALLFLGGRAAIGSLTVNGRSTDVWALPDTDVTVAWDASRGGAGSVVSLRITDGTSVLLDRPGLAATGSLVFHTPATTRERTFRVTAIASHRCGNDTRALDMLITMPSELTILGIEVTQATQFSRSNLHLPADTFQADNSVPLIENKRTLIRVYVDSGLDGFDLGRGTGVVPGVTAQLHGTRGGAPLPGSPLNALNQPIQVSRNAPYLTVRQQWQSTLNFELPASWLSGAVTLRTVVDPTFALRRRHSGTVATQTSVSFVSARPLKLVGVMIRYTGWQSDSAGNRVRVDIAAPAFATLVNAANWLRRTYPTNDIQFFTAPGNKTITFDGDLTDGSGGGCGDEWGDLMDELRDLADDYSADEDAVWVGVLPTGWGGAAWGGCGGGADGAIGAAVIFANDTGSTLAQEAGHGYGRNHAPGCGAGSPDGSYPAYGKASSASIGEFGADWPTPGSTAWQIQDPAARNDFMGYCGSDWVSPYRIQY